MSTVETEPTAYQEFRASEMKKHGTVRCAFCAWRRSGPMSEVIQEQIKHRESHGVEHHPDVARRAGSAKRSDAQKKRMALARAKKTADRVAAQGGWIERESLSQQVAATTIAAALNAKLLVTRTRDGVPGYAIPGSEPAVEDATSRDAVSVA